MYSAAMPNSSSQVDQTARPRPVVLCVLDGWGLRDGGDDNAIARAATPHWDALMRTCAHAAVATSGGDVGLTDGQMGNSEVGHMNIGAGRVVMQDLPRIDRAVADGALAANAVLAQFIADLRAAGGVCHLLGLVSPGGVHSHQDHMVALARILADHGIGVRIHAFLDGRDTPPKSARGFMARFTEALRGCADVTVATVCGRYYAMDRDKRWERVSQAYATLVQGTGRTAADALAAIDAAYEAGESDEFVLPTAVAGFAGMADGDGLLMANFRADRAREILTALVDPHFDGFARAKTATFAAKAGMVSYSTALDEFLPALFPPIELHNTLGELVADAGMRQLRIAETEKYAHVTFFLNGGEERVFAGEDRELIPSPKVATYDLQPEMAAPEVTDKLVAAIGSGRYDLIVVNYANPDMVGHTGILAAAIKAVETIDACLGRLEAAVIKAGGVMLITADHGNIEQMSDHGGPHTAHTTNLVPLVLVNGAAGIGLRDGRLADIAPTLLTFLGLPVPADMTGRSLITDAAAVSGRDQRASA